MWKCAVPLQSWLLGKPYTTGTSAQLCSAPARLRAVLGGCLCSSLVSSVTSCKWYFKQYLAELKASLSESIKNTTLAEPRWEMAVWERTVGQGQCPGGPAGGHRDTCTGLGLSDAGRIIWVSHPSWNTVSKRKGKALVCTAGSWSCCFTAHKPSRLVAVNWGAFHRNPISHRHPTGAPSSALAAGHPLTPQGTWNTG